jgi:hypothetical protein
LRQQVRKLHGFEIANLVPWKGVKVNSESLYINLSMRREADAINAKHSADIVDCIRDCADIMDRAKQVRNVSACNKLDFGRQQRLQVLRCKHQSILFWRLPPLHCQLKPLGHEQPRLDVRFVLHLCQNDLVAFIKLERGGEVHEELRGWASEHCDLSVRTFCILWTMYTNLIASGIDILGCSTVTIFVLGVGLGAGVIWCTKLNIGFREIGGNPDHASSVYWLIQRNSRASRINYSYQCLTAPSIVEEDLILLQCGKVLAGFADIEWHGDGGNGRSQKQQLWAN